MSDVRAEFVPDDWDGKDGSDMCLAVFVDNRLGYVWSDEHPMYVLVRQLQEQLEARPVYGTSACGHSEQFIDWEDHSLPVACLKCERVRLTARLAEAEAALTQRSLAETRYEELRELIARGSRSMAHEDLVSQLRVNNELIATRDQKVADARIDNKRLKEACWIFRTYGLAPNDVSGQAEWKRAIGLAGGTP